MVALCLWKPVCYNSSRWRVKYNVSCLCITPLHFAFNRIAMILFPCVAYQIVVATRGLTQLIQLNKVNISSFTWKLWLMMTLASFTVMYLAQIQLNDMAREDVCDFSWWMMSTGALRKMAMKYSRNFMVIKYVRKEIAALFSPFCSLQLMFLFKAFLNS